MKAVYFVLFITLSFSAYSQNDSLRLGAKFGSYNEELTELYQMLNMEVYQFHLPLREVKDKKVKFSYVQYEDDTLSEEKFLYPKEGLDMKNPRGAFENDSIYTFKVAAQKQKDDKTEIWLRFPQFGLSRLSFETISTDRYSLRDFITTTGKRYSDIPVGKRIPFLAYSLPYEKDGVLYYCSITSDGVQPEQWAETYDIEHYIIFYIQIEE